MRSSDATSLRFRLCRLEGARAATTARAHRGVGQLIKRTSTGSLLQHVLAVRLRGISPCLIKRASLAECCRPTVGQGAPRCGSAPMHRGSLLLRVADCAERIVDLIGRMKSV